MEAVMNTANETPMNGAKEFLDGDMNYMSEFAGQGLEEMQGDAVSVGYLSIVQPGSSFEDDEHAVGTWRNSASNRCLGNTVTVVPLAFKTIWVERDADTFSTVARYAPHDTSVQVEIRNPPAGKRGFPKMYNKATGNEIQELFVYAVMLPDYPEEGVIYFQPTAGSMRACKSWNTQLKGQILPNGAQAPIFAYSWDLYLEVGSNASGKSFARLARAAKNTLVNKDLFNNNIKPVLADVRSNTLAITSNVEVEE